MIAYEELEKALARWKARRPDAATGGVSAGVSGGAALSGPEELGEATPMAREELGEATPMRRDEDLEATSMGEADSGIPTGVSAEDGQASDSTGELDIGDAVPEER